MIPACGMLWAGKGARRWIAFGLSSAAIFFSSDLANLFLGIVAGRMDPVIATPGEKLEALLLHPAPLLLLAAGCFYLWVYIRYSPDGAAEKADRVNAAAAAASRV
jgi:hypothetical protein